MAVAAFFPAAFAGFEVDAGVDAVIEAVEFAAHFQRIAKFGLHFVVLPDPAGLPFAVFFLELEERGADAVAARNQQAVVAEHDRLADVGLRGRPAAAPQKFAGGRIVAGDRSLVEDHDLLLAVEFGDQRRRKRCSVVARGPYRLAGVAPIGDQRFVVFAAD